MKKIFSIATLVTSIFANNYQQFQNQYANGYQHYQKQTKQEFINYQKTLIDGFKEYKATLDKEFANYRKSLSKYWKNPELTTKTTFVEYSKDKKVRKKVNYKKQYIEIDVIAKNKIEAKRKMAKALFNLTSENVAQAFDKNPVLTKVNQKLASNPKFSSIIKVSKPSKEPIVTDMVFKKPPTPTQVVNYAINNVKKHSKSIVVKKSKLPHMHVYSMKIKLPSSSLLAKARIYKSAVFKRSKQFNIQPEFIYAIIHTESYFNPGARSYIPAFGLMQIVPRSAGADAYKMLTGKKKLLTPSYLYNANNNILIGTAYLKKLYYVYMRKIKNPTSRLYCTIAAYNTGAGNVACAFNSTTKSHGVTQCRSSRHDYNINIASSKINKMTPQEVYNHLLSNLKYKEAQNYLKRVSKRMHMYKKALDKNAL